MTLDDFPDDKDKLKKAIKKEIDRTAGARRTLETDAIVWWLIGRCITLALNLPEETSKLIGAQRKNLQHVRGTIIAMLESSIWAMSLKQEIGEAAKVLERGVEGL